MKTPHFRENGSRAHKDVGFGIGRSFGLASLALLLAIAFPAGNSQTAMSGSGNPIPDYSGIPPMKLATNPMPDVNHLTMDSMRMRQYLKFLERLNVARQKEMTADTQRLLALANQLQAETDSAAGQIPVIEAVRQAEQIEKLAHSVREKMKASVTY